MRVETVDYHAGGEPFRVVVGGGPEVGGDTVRGRRECARGDARVDGPIDRVRRLLCHEPRGHAGMYGCFLVPPDDAGADLGVLFWHGEGYSTACGHGTIALGTWAVQTGLVAAWPDGDTDVRIDVPSGRVTARVRCRGGRVEHVTFRNVSAYVIARAVPVRTEYGVLPVDVSYGGAIYASVPADALGLRVVPEQVGELIRAGRAVKRALSGHDAARHPTDERLSGVYGTIIHERLADTAGGPSQRNVTVFADGQVDRSPCGSGTSARLALLAADGELDGGRVLRHESIVGTVFTGTVVAHPADGVITEVTGTAHRTGEHVFTLDPHDELGTGFVLR